MEPKVVQLLTERDRAILNRLRKAAVAAGIAPEKVQPSYLRVAVLLDPSQSEYAFQIRKDVGVSLKHDRKLDQNDSFVITDLGIGLLAESPANPGTGLLQAYPNNIPFAAVAGEVNPLHLNTIYNGFYKIKVDDTVFAESIPTDSMLCVRTTLQSAATNFSERILKDGTVPLTPDITLNGSKKNEITLGIPTFAGMQIQHATAATRNYVVFRAYGFLISGGSSLGALNQ